MTQPLRPDKPRLRLVPGQATSSAAAERLAPPPSAAAPALAGRRGSARPDGGADRLPSERSTSRGALAELPDEGLVALGVRGDVAACEQLYRRHVSFALNLATHIAGSPRDVEDVVHDAFLRAFDGLSSLRKPQAFRGWLGSIVVHGVRDRLRRGRLLRLFGLGQAGDPIDLESLASPEAPPSARAQLAQIYALLQALPLDDRIAWTLRFVQGHDLAETATLARCSLATVKRRIRRAQAFVESHFVDSSAGSNPRESEP